MSTMTKSRWQQAKEQVLIKAQEKARRKGKGLKVYSREDLLFHTSHGWKILSHNPSSYGRPQFWILVPE